DQNDRCQQRTTKASNLHSNKMDALTRQRKTNSGYSPPASSSLGTGSNFDSTLLTGRFSRCIARTTLRANSSNTAHGSRQGITLLSVTTSGAKPDTSQS